MAERIAPLRSMMLVDDIEQVPRIAPEAIEEWRVGKRVCHWSGRLRQHSPQSVCVCVGILLTRFMKGHPSRHG
jgi:hypothetical protein